MTLWSVAYGLCHIKPVGDLGQRSEIISLVTIGNRL